MKEFYSINDISLMSGLTSRTIRNYIEMGLLEGEKVSGQWQFSSDQVRQLFEHPFVKPSIQAKKNALVLDFIADTHKKTGQICLIYDIPGENSWQIAHRIIPLYNDGGYANDLQLSIESDKMSSRIILKGQSEDVLHLINAFKVSVDNF